MGVIEQLWQIALKKRLRTAETASEAVQSFPRINSRPVSVEIPRNFSGDLGNTKFYANQNSTSTSPSKHFSKIELERRKSFKIYNETFRLPRDEVHIQSFFLN